MKKRYLAWLIAVLMLWQPAALAAETWSGSVVQGTQIAVRAAYGGTVDDVHLQAGDVARAGDTILTLSGEKIYSPWNGTVTALFAGEGDDAAYATERWGAAAMIAPREKFLVYMTVDEQYNLSDTRRISLGQTVWMRCAKDGTHRGFGVVIDAEGTEYTVEVTGGQFSNGEVVYAGLREGYYKSERVGTGTVLAAEVRPVEGSGTVVRSCIAEGDSVERGQLLMEVAGGVPTGAAWNNGSVAADAAGVIVSVNVSKGDTVQQGDVVAVIAADTLVETVLPEEDLTLLREGDPVRLVWEDGEGMGEVIFISHMADENGDFQVLIRPENEFAYIAQSVDIETIE